MRRLEGPELARYDLVDPDIAARARILTVPFLAPGASGMTIGRFVFLRRDHERGGGRELLAHELVHVRQYAEAGTIRFLLGYLRDYVGALRRLRNHRAAYLAIPAEAEARAEAEAWAARS
ncbi:MAG: DUF4157 domain-containing protein [Acidimicrobiales bacterium]|nr:DUF4157 domain-containing protein [Acidimicrobiales bacterium]